MAGWKVIPIRKVSVVMVLILAVQTALAQYDDEADYVERSTQPEISTTFVPESSTPPPHFTMDRTQTEVSPERSFPRSRSVDFPFETSTHASAWDFPTVPQSPLTSSLSQPMTSLAPWAERTTEATEAVTPEVASTTITEASTGGVVPHVGLSSTEHRITFGHTYQITSQRHDEAALHTHTHGAPSTLLTSQVTSESATSEHDPHFLSISAASTQSTSHQPLPATPLFTTEAHPSASLVSTETLPQSPAVSMASHTMGNRTATVAASTTELTPPTMSVLTQAQGAHVPVTYVLHGESTLMPSTVPTTEEAALGSSVDESEIVLASTTPAVTVPIAAVTEAMGQRVTGDSTTSAAPARSRILTELTPTSSEEVSSPFTQVSSDHESPAEAVLPNRTSSTVNDSVDSDTTLSADTSQPTTGHLVVSHALSSSIAAVNTTATTASTQPTNSTSSHATTTALPPSPANNTRPPATRTASNVNATLSTTSTSRHNSTATAAFASIINSTSTAYATNDTDIPASIPTINSTSFRTSTPVINLTITTTTERISSSENATTRIISTTIPGAIPPRITTTPSITTTPTITTTLPTPTVTTTRITTTSRTPVVPRVNSTTPTTATRRTAVTRSMPPTTGKAATTTATASTTRTTWTMAELESITTDVRYMLTLTGDCRVVVNNTEYFQRFLHGFHDLIVRHLKITEKYTLGEISCGSVHVYVTFERVLWPDFDVMLQSVIRNGGPGLALPVWMENDFVTFELARAKRVPLDPTDAHTYNVITEVMDDVDIVVIIVACCVCGVLIAIGVIICVKECYRRKHAQSFNLLEVPHLNVKPEDFTLTRIPRPRAVYSDPGSAPQTQKGFAELDREDPSRRVLNLPSGPSSLSRNGDGGRDNGGGLSPSDLHLRVKEHSDGLIVGVTASTYYAPASNGINGNHHKHNHHHRVHSEAQNGAASREGPRKPRLRIPVEDVPRCAADDSPASQRLLDSAPRGPGDQGNLNPVYMEERLEVRNVGANKDSH